MSCQESFGEGRTRPQVRESFPARAHAGHATELELVIEHLPLETVLPAGLELTADSDEGRAITSAHFQFPDPSSETKPVLERKEEGGHVTTHLRLPLVPLPPAPGRLELTLPPLPIHIARPSGQVDTLCTTEHVITIEDPLAGSNQTELHPDPPPRPQREIWTTARDVTLGLLLALPLLLALLWLARKYAPSLRRKPAPPPPVSAWDAALASLARLEREGLLEKQQYEAYLDRVSDTLRAYLGDRYGAGGLEATTRETLRLLGERAPGFEFERQVRAILQRADLVKFARRIPEESECREAFVETKHIVQRTTPAPSLDPRASTSPTRGKP